MRHNRRRRNPVLTPDQVFSAVLADLSIDDPELAKFAYQNASYFIEYARKAVGDGGSLTEDELIEQIRTTGRGISKRDEKIARDCMSAISPQARPADLIHRYLAFLESQGTENENRDLIEFGVLAYRYGFTTNSPLEITEEEAHEIVGFPSYCSDPSIGKEEYIRAFVDWNISEWMKKAEKRAEGFGQREQPEDTFTIEPEPPQAKIQRTKPRRRQLGILMGGGPVNTRGGRRRRGGRRCRSWCNAETPDDCLCGALNNER